MEFQYRIEKGAESTIDINSMKPCPFCHEMALRIEVSELTLLCDVKVFCRQCGMRGPNGNRTVDEAVKSWNERGCE